MHRAAAAAAVAGVSAGQFGKQKIGLGAAGQKVPVRAMGPVQIITIRQRRRDADGNPFLTDPDMDQAGQFLLMAQLDHALFEAANEPHAPQHIAVQSL